jgi:23S rRNA (cytosine1962-C5)-methyltransferase
VWRDAVAKGLEQAQPGEQVQVIAADGTPVGRGLADPGSPIGVRMWTRGRKVIDEALWSARIERAAGLRERLAPPRTNALRLLHGEGDRMPGFVVDRYGSVAVVRTDGEAAGARLSDLVRAISPIAESWGLSTIVHRVAARDGAESKRGAPELRVLRGDAAPRVVRVEEHGVPFVVDVAHGQKTGAFLDQRDNRRRVGELARGRRVLNLFSYAGGFSLHAALGGAAEVTSVDVAAAAHATAQESFRAAGVETAKHPFVTADVRTFLDAARGRGQSWDLVVSDPPSFAPNEKAVARALSAYRGLHRACAQVLAPGGILCAASCSSHVDAGAFLTTLDDAALDGVDLRLVELRGAGFDHPTLPAFPEGRYLKFAVLA